MRGIGVADMTSRCGECPAAASRARCATPAVLLVGDDEAEIVEDGLLREERVRADDQLDAPIGQSGEHRAALRRGHGAGEQRDRNAERREQTRASPRASARISVGAMNAA